MKKLFILLLMAVAFCGSAEAQFVNNGKIIDKKGKPISGATVRGKGLMSSTTSNMDGSFSFETTLPIKQIEASYMGKSKTKKRTEYTVITLGNGNGGSGSLGNHPWFVNPQISYDSNRENVQIGLMAGYVKDWGGYFNVMGHGKYDQLSLSGGIVKKIIKGVNVFVGGGYSSFEDYYKRSSYKPKQIDIFFVDMGLLFKLNRFTSNIGISTEFDHTTYIRIGLGYSF